ncbi:MAG: glucoamylase family protein [Gemmatimonadales bacterium]
MPVLMRRPAFLLLAGLAGALGCGDNPPAPVTDPEPSPRALALMDTVEQRTFQFFWERSDPVTGLTPDRWPNETFASIAAVGYALTAYPIGVDRGYIARADAAQRTLTTLRWFWQAPQGPDQAGMTGYQGFFYHFLTNGTGARFKDVELSTQDTALLLMGVLFCREYYDGADPAEAEIRALADSLYRRVNWTWAQRTPPKVNMGWKPEDPNGGWQPLDWMGYNEAGMVYILALGSPTHTVDSTAWAAWAATYDWGSYYGQSHLGFAPLFGHQFTHVWVDFRGIQDPFMRSHGIDYFENSRRATLAQRAYAVDNPMGWAGYGANAWGISASDGPADVTLDYTGKARRFFTYAARGASYTEVRDDGTIAPTAAASSLPFAPEIVLPALVAMREQYGDDLFGQYGFVDAFNPSFQFTGKNTAGKVVTGKGWFDDDYLGLDQGPILAMIANYRSDFVWKYMRKSPYIIRGLRRAGFSGGWLDQAP